MEASTLTPRSVGPPADATRPRSGPGRLVHRARGVIGYLALAGCVAVSLRIVTAAASHPLRQVPARRGGLPGWLRGPLSGTGYWLAPRQFALLALALTAGYLVALACAPALRARWAIAAIVALHAIFFLGPPLISSDFFGYLDWARMGALHGLDPYSHASGTVVSDPVYPFLTWHRGVSPYGPLFTLATYALAPLGLPVAVWVLKAVVTLSSLGCLALVWRIAGALRRPPLTGAVLYGLNPAVLIYTVGGFHNDALQMMVAMGAVYLVVVGRERAGAVAGVLAVGVKTSAGLVLPFLILGARRRARALAAAAIAAVGVLAVALGAFGTRMFGFLAALSDQQNRNSLTSVPAQLGDWLGWTGSPEHVRLAASVIAVVLVLALMVRAWRGADWIESAGWATLVVMASSAYLLPWYLIWLVPLAAVGASRALRLATVAMTVFVIAVRAAPGLLSVGAGGTALHVLVVTLVAPLAGTPSHQPPRISVRALQPATAHAFERAADAHRRMTTGSAISAVSGAHSRCEPLASEPAASRDWAWACQVNYGVPDRPRGVVDYVTAVDRRGCFTAVTPAYPTVVFEPVLRRRATNPLARLEGCP